jgi:hypothetical protein
MTQAAAAELAANERRGPAKVAQRPERSRSQAATMRLEGIATGSRGAGAAEATKAQTFRSFSAVWVSVVRATHASSSAVKVFSAAVWIINAGAELQRRSLFSRWVITTHTPTDASYRRSATSFATAPFIFNILKKLISFQFDYLKILDLIWFLM